VLAAIVDIPPHVGYAAVFALIAVETMGIPVPGETALIAAALLAHDGQLSIVPLVAIAAAAAIIGDNVGFAIGRHGGRRLFLRPGPFHDHRLRIIEHGEPFFEKHGPKAVFLGRWVAGLRIASAWLAGMNKMSWPTFLFWNALGGIFWATTVALVAYYLGRGAERVFNAAGLGGAGVVVVGAIIVWLIIRRRERAGDGRRRVD
jgi:membrane protein DedA with SNARE-associated domain